MIKIYLLKVLRHVYVKPLWTFFAYTIVTIGGIPAAAWLTLRSVDYGKIQKEQKTVLCIARDYFSKDILELRKRSELNYISIQGGYTRLQGMFFPKQMQIQTYYQGLKGPQYDLAIHRSTEYANRIIAGVSNRLKVNAILSANFDYWQDVGFKRASKALGIPFLVLSREHITAPNVFDTFVRRHMKANYKFLGAGIAVAGRNTYDAINSVPQIIDTDDVWITGLPRLDIWREIDTSIPLNERQYITLITYTKNYQADENFVEVVTLFSRLATAYPTSRVNFVVKLKNYDDQLDVFHILRNEDTSNLQFTYDRPLPDLLTKSRLVIGFNSLAVIEAVLARATLVTPIWGVKDNDLKNTMYDLASEDVRTIINMVKSTDDIQRQVEKSISNRHTMISKQQAFQFANDFFYITDESTASKRVEEFILNYVIKSTDQTRTT